MKSILISIQPKWCELIASGKKTVEVRKSKPKLETPFKCYIYATKPKKYYKVSEHLATSDESLYLAKGKVQMCNGFEFWAEGVEYEFLSGKVIGEFVCDTIHNIKIEEDFETGASSWECGYYADEDCLSMEEFEAYLKKGLGYGWHISDLVIYDKPKVLSEFFKACDKPKGTDCSLCVDRRENKCKSITRPPQSWCYVEE